ncbi:MAG TPA: DUF3489 domain-containing protein [Sphingomicrobium sp.]|jgi:hypothetical protein
MKLNDTQLILLTTASQRENGSLMPLPDTLAGTAERAKKMIVTLIKKVLAEEEPVLEPTFAWREENGRWIGVRITDAGRQAIGVDEPNAQKTATTAETLAAPKVTKSSLVLEMLRRNDGATLDELVAATGWLRHTTRAALTGLRKKGHAIEKTKRTDATSYHIAAQA